MPESWPKMPEKPKRSGYLWDWYQALDGEHTAVNMKAFFDMRGIEPKEWELEALQTLVRISRITDPEKPSQ
ncbi:MAG: hypothetical protein ACPHUL_00055 [Marinomonas gallaica]